MHCKHDYRIISGFRRQGKVKVVRASSFVIAIFGLALVVLDAKSASREILYAQLQAEIGHYYP